jgi:hypothetical protein
LGLDNAAPWISCAVPIQEPQVHYQTRPRPPTPPHFPIGQFPHRRQRRNCLRQKTGLKGNGQSGPQGELEGIKKNWNALELLDIHSAKTPLQKIIWHLCSVSMHIHAAIRFELIFVLNISSVSWARTVSERKVVHGGPILLL